MMRESFHCPDNLARAFLNFQNHTARLIGERQPVFGVRAAISHVSYRFIDEFLVLLNHGHDFLGRRAGSARKLADLISYHRKSSTLLTCPSSFDGRVQCQEIGLLRDAANGLNDGADQ